MEDKQFIVLVIYDIVDNKQRTKLVRCLERYGKRVQKSAFEGFLTQKQYTQMIEKSQKYINPKTDSFRVYIVDNFINTYSFGIDSREKFDYFVL